MKQQKPDKSQQPQKQYQPLLSLLILLAILSLVACKPTPKERLTDYVNPFIGTDEDGHTFPGALVPFGMVQLSPDNGDNGYNWCSGYHYTSSHIQGFSHTHYSGTGAEDLCDISVFQWSIWNHHPKPSEANSPMPMRPPIPVIIPFCSKPLM